MASLRFLLVLLSFCILSADGNQMYQTATFNGGGTMHYYSKDINGVYVQTLLWATIEPQNIRPPRTRVEFPKTKAISQRMEQMNANPRTQTSGDDRGHLLASQLGGNGELWNLAPQDMYLNQNIGPQSVVEDWYEKETEIADYLRKNCGKVLWHLEINYDDESRPRRPSSFFLNIKYYDGSGKLCKEDLAYLSNKARQPGDVDRHRIINRRCFEDLCIMEISGIGLFAAWIAQWGKRPNTECPLCRKSLTRRSEGENYVRIFTDKNFGGDDFTIRLNQRTDCVLLNRFNNKVSSLFVGEDSCVKFWEHENCNGANLQQNYGYRLNLEHDPRSSGGNWNDEIGSISGCNY